MGGLKLHAWVNKLCASGARQPAPYPAAPVCGFAFAGFGVAGAGLQGSTTQADSSIMAQAQAGIEEAWQQAQGCGPDQGDSPARANMSKGEQRNRSKTKFKEYRERQGPGDADGSPSSSFSKSQRLLEQRPALDRLRDSVASREQRPLGNAGAEGVLRRARRQPRQHPAVPSFVRSGRMDVSVEERIGKIRQSIRDGGACLA